MKNRIIVDDEMIDYYYEEYVAVKNKYESFGQTFNLTFNQFLNGKVAMLETKGVDILA